MVDLSEWVTPGLVWFFIGLFLLLLEFASPGLIIFFFGIGAWVVSLVCLVMDISLNAQLLVFIISSILLLLLLRNRLQSIFYGFGTSKKDMTQDYRDLVGETAIVREEVRGRVKGRVEVHGTNWDAVSDISEGSIPAGTTVEIVGKDSLTLTVKPLNKYKEVQG